VLEVLEPVLTSAGYDLEDLAFTTAGRRRLLRVVVDRDGGVDLDAIADVSRLVSEVLDDTDAMGPAAYVLEVTSPGVDRPLVQPRHWRRAVGRLVTASLAAGGEVTGRVVAADDTGVTFEVAGAEARYAHADLRRGRVQVEFTHAPQEAS
jgi:ribosome maturation factor RimP